jgi:hypothetical protein
MLKRLCYILIAMLIMSKLVFTQVYLLYDTNLNTRLQGYNKIVNVSDSLSKEKIINELIGILKSDSIVDSCFNGTLHLTIKTLGELKAKEAIDPLVKYLTYIPCNYTIESIIPTQIYYPAVLAYIQIGKESLSKMIEIIDSTQSSEKQKELASYIIMKILGKEKAVTKLKAIEKKKDSIKLKSGKKFSDYIEEFKPTFNHPNLSK